jgi:hypothetical protein
VKKYKIPPPPDYTEMLEEMFGPGYRIAWEEWVLGPGSTRWDHKFVQELYRLDEWARTGVEPPPVIWPPRLVWRIKKWLGKD